MVLPAANASYLLLAHPLDVVRHHASLVLLIRVDLSTALAICVVS